MSSIRQEIERIVGKLPIQRSDEEVDKLLPWFRKKSDVFLSLKPDAVSDIIRNCEMIRRRKDNVIIKQGDKGNCFFIVLHGKVSVHIATKDDDDDEADDEREEVCDSALGLPIHQSFDQTEDNYRQSSVQDYRRQTTNGDENSVASSGTPREPLLPRLVTSTSLVKTSPLSVEENAVEAFHLFPLAGSPPLDRSKYGQYVATLVLGIDGNTWNLRMRCNCDTHLLLEQGDGKSFGELALLKKDCIRNATVITDSSTQLLVVNRQLYNRCIRESQEKEFQAKQMFVHTSEYFEGWTLKSKRHFAMSLQLRSYTYGTPVVCQGQPLDYIYFLQSGQCRVIIDPTCHHSQYPNYDLHKKYKAAESLESACEEYSSPKIVRRGRRKGYPVRGYDICLIGEFNMIGDVELCTNLPTYMQTVICEQHTEAFAIDLRNYERLVTKRHSSTGRLITQNALLKLYNRAVRFQNIPLLSCLIEKFSRSSEHKHKKHSPEERLLAAPPPGPLVDIFGPGTVFHYIRTRQRQLQKAKAAAERSSIVIHKRNNGKSFHARQSESLAANDLLPFKAVTPPRHEAVRFHMFEEKRVSQLERKVIAWHDEIRKANLLPDLNTSAKGPIDDYLQTNEREQSADVQ